MDIFSDFELTADRMAELLLIPPSEYAVHLHRWFEDDQRTVKRRGYYRPTYEAVDDLHQHRCLVEDVRVRMDTWRLDAAVNAGVRDQMNHNIRATTQYLAQHGDRELLVFTRQRLEAVVASVLVTAKPQMFVQEGGTPLRIWHDCSETFRDDYLNAKCNVALWAARRMRAVDAQVEAIHPASGRIVARGVLPVNFEERIEGVCAVVHRVWERLRNDSSRRPRDVQ